VLDVSTVSLGIGTGHGQFAPGVATAYVVIMAAVTGRDVVDDTVDMDILVCERIGHVGC